jgi:hypothetical protein
MTRNSYFHRMARGAEAGTLKPPRLLFRAEPEITRIASANEPPAPTVCSLPAGTGVEGRQESVTQQKLTTPTPSSTPGDRSGDSHAPAAFVPHPSPAAAPAPVSNPVSIDTHRSPGRSAPSSSRSETPVAQNAPAVQLPDAVADKKSMPLIPIQPIQPSRDSRLPALGARDPAESNRQPAQSARESQTALEDRPGTARPVPWSEPPAARPSQPEQPGSTVGTSTPPNLEPPIPSARVAHRPASPSERTVMGNAVVIRSLEVRIVPPAKPAFPTPDSRTAEAGTIIQSLSRGFQVYGLPQGY